MLRSERYAGLFRVDRAAHALEHDRFLAEQIGDELGAVVIVDAEYLQDAGVRQEGAGAALVERAELVNVLQDRPELDAVAGHEAHSARGRGGPPPLLKRFQTLPFLVLPGCRNGTGRGCGTCRRPMTSLWNKEGMHHA